MTTAERLRVYAAGGMTVTVTLTPHELIQIADMLEGNVKILAGLDADLTSIEQLHRRAKAYLLLSAALGLTLAVALVVTVS